ncbi:class II glutamine amidotransferase [Nocardia sp. CDC159]|uniref:Class II glutamine amidotransferase n=1 Tax=Nocardia pulmonis TaxID=2951408 RepID=A0A9X2E7Z8_9NOCA|nr:MULTISPECIES: class II glutamine amidotransferase [Nocardia]MCM6774540.1 class II glutamine amidotransferase [Nocardia pulmonis]MCM6787394.1 class II glutamine amidotransferase [Nocardia sp. CDC159]
MCLLTYLPPGTAPDNDALTAGARVNRDGHGFAIVTDSNILVGHGMDAETVIAEFVRVRNDFPDGPALFHSRLATHGAISISNCHPFHLGRDQRTVLAHNGVLPRRVQPRGRDLRSDTRIAAEEYLPARPFGSLDTARGRRRLESWLGASKLILTTNPEYAAQGYIFNEHAGMWHGGIWYSNASYLPGHQASWVWMHTCGRCHTVDFARLGRYCGICGWCFWCTNPHPDCDCTPSPQVTATVTSISPPHRRGHQLAFLPTAGDP